MIFFTSRKLKINCKKFTIVLVLFLVILKFYNYMKTENHLRVLKLLSKNVNKSIDYNTDNWIFNYNISQFSSILRIKYDVAYLESLIFVDIEEKKFLETN